MKNSRLGKKIDGALEDMIRSFVQYGCAELHSKTLLEKYISQLENGLIDADDPEILNRHLQLIDSIKEMMNEQAELRRNAMQYLFDHSENGNPDMWCLVKHLSIGAMTTFESYQATDDDPALMNLWLEANKSFLKALSLFLGYEITECAACFSDMVKGIKGETDNG